MIAQNRASAQAFEMPGAAIETGSVDYILSIEKIAPTLDQLVRFGRTPTLR